MNCPSRNDETLEHDGWNQNPSALAADLTTREDLNGIVNRRTNQDSGKEAEDARTELQGDGAAEYRRLTDPLETPSGINHDGIQNNDPVGRVSFLDPNRGPLFGRRRRGPRASNSYESFPELDIANTRSTAVTSGRSHSRSNASSHGSLGNMPKPVRIVGQVLRKFLGFIGPGFMVAVAYIDPGNYSTDVAAGVATKFKLLFIVLMSNIFAIVLQSLAIRLGTVTGMNLAEHCRAHLPRWLNLALYVIGEAAIVATDIAEVSLFLAERMEFCLTVLAGDRLCYSS